MVDDTLYDAFGQRQISIMFTQLNQYHVVLEIKPDSSRTRPSLKNIYVRSADAAAQVPLDAVHAFPRSRRRRWR